MRRVLEHVHLDLGRVDLHAGALGELGEAEDVVPVRVRDQDPAACRSHARQLQADRGRVAARIDDGRLRRAALQPHDVAVRADRAQLVAVDDESHRLSLRSGYLVFFEDRSARFASRFWYERYANESTRYMNGTSSTMSGSVRRSTTAVESPFPFVM